MTPEPASPRRDLLPYSVSDANMLILTVSLLMLPSLVALCLLPKQPSRRVLCIALSLTIPIAGPILALVAARVQGSAGGVEEPPRLEPEQVVCADDVRRMAELPPLLDQLVSSSPSDRLAALVTLSTRADASAALLLRWTVDHGPPAAVLDAALTQQELDVRQEQQLRAAMDALAAEPSFEHALAAGDAAAYGILTQTADPAITPMLAQQARDLYAQASSLDEAGAHWHLVTVRLARLELAAGRPSVAAEMATRLRADSGDDPELHQLCDEIFFCARRFDQLTELPATAGDLGDTASLGTGTDTRAVAALPPAPTTARTPES